MNHKRSYFYYLNERGNLFHVFDVKGLLEKKTIPSGPTFLTASQFLGFFFNRIEYNNVGHIYAAFQDGNTTENILHTSHSLFLNSQDFLLKATIKLGDCGVTTTPLQALLNFPYVSLCRNEINFVNVQDGVPIVFDRLILRGADGMPALVYASGTKQEPFRPSSIAVTEDGKMFHQLTTLHKLLDVAGKPLVSCSRDANDSTARSGHGGWQALGERPLSSADLLTCSDDTGKLLLERLCDLKRMGQDTSVPPFLFSEAKAISERLLPPRGLLGASIGLQLGFDYVCDEKDSEGHYVMMWEGEKLILPFL